MNYDIQDVSRSTSTGGIYMTDSVMRPIGIRWAGDRSLLLDFSTLEAAMSSASVLRRDPIHGQVDVIAGARTSLLQFSSSFRAARALEHLKLIEFEKVETKDSQHVKLDVAYDGPDLRGAADELAMSPEALINWHTNQLWVGAFFGFAGFTYCVAESPRSVSRHMTPRTAVPAGSVGLAGEFSGVYPRRAPGGWQLIGRTDAIMWDVDRDLPSLVQPWDTVKFRCVRPEAVLRASISELSTDAKPGTDTSSGDQSGKLAADNDAVLIISAGLQTLVEDRGRQGFASVGVGQSGAFDRMAAQTANNLVGNHADAAVLEILFGGLRVQALRPLVAAVSGAATELSIKSDSGPDRRPRCDTPFILLDGDELEIDTPEKGARNVLALRGGVLAESIFGSKSTDTHIEIGPAPLRAGDTVKTASAVDSSVLQTQATTIDQPPLGESFQRGPISHGMTTQEYEDVTTIRARPGPRDAWFTEEELDHFFSQVWSVSGDSNRIGIRFDLPVAEGSREFSRKESTELLSEGMALGSVQVPPSGMPVLLVNDQGITGGYPVIAVVLSEDLSLAAQLRPGSRVRFQSLSQPVSSSTETKGRE